MNSVDGGPRNAAEHDGVQDDCLRAERLDDGDAGDADPIRATLAAWREGNEHTLDPVRFRFIESLAERAANHSGAARQVLDRRIRGLVDAYREDLTAGAAPEPHADHAGDPMHESEVAQDTSTATAGADFEATLSTLLDDIAGRLPEQAAGIDDETALRRAAYPEIPDLDYFKKAWSLVSSDSQLRQSLEQVHENAGPLNSSRLVHQSLLLMRELSPGYLHQFLSYVDALSWMEQLNTATAPAPKETPKTPAARKGARSKA